MAFRTLGPFREAGRKNVTKQTTKNVKNVIYVGNVAYCHKIPRWAKIQIDVRNLLSEMWRNDQWRSIRKEGLLLRGSFDHLRMVLRVFMSKCNNRCNNLKLQSFYFLCNDNRVTAPWNNLCQAAEGSCGTPDALHEAQKTFPSFWEDFQSHLLLPDRWK